jgi:hypothetical protein
MLLIKNEKLHIFLQTNTLYFLFNECKQFLDRW